MSSLASQRVLFSNNGTLEDASVEFNDFISGSLTFSYVSGEDYLYVGSDLPFNQKYFHLGDAVNAQSATVSVDLWDGSSWQSAVDVIDRTLSGGASLAQSGYISWVPDPDETWSSEPESTDVTGLSGTKMYDLYWARFSWPADLNSVILSHLGHRFSTDNDIFGIYPDLNNTTLMGAFSSGQTDWVPQSFYAAEAIVDDLVRRNIVVHESQVLDYRRFRMASIHKTAEIIYRGLGRNEDRVKEVATEYRKAMDMKRYWVDLNRDATLQQGEKQSTTVVLTRG